MNETQIPLFPLALVPLPGEPVPLHIFEPRYKQLVADSAPSPGHQEYRPFGIQYSHQNKLHPFGCTVVIHQILHKYPDGRLDIMTLGQQRYELLEVFDERAYLMGRVRFFDDPESERMPDPLILKQILAICEKFLEQMGSRVRLHITAPQPSFELAVLLNPEIETRLQLLETRSENQRLEILRKYLDTLSDHLEKLQAFQRRVRSNGHF